MSHTDGANANNAQEQELPAQGGSYERQGDGSLERVAGTEPAPDRAATLPDQPEDDQAQERPARQPRISSRTTEE